MAAISVSGITKDFGDVTVLRGIDLEIADGEFVVLVGPSGCGKSTLLRVIAGLEDAGSGEIRIDGRAVDALPPRERDLAMVFQSYALYPHMTVRGNLSYGLRLRGIDRRRIDGLVEATATRLGIAALLERKPGELSGGQRQRVAMGRAIVREPKAFLFDEPLSNLDARLREQMRFEIRRLYQDLRTTSVYVTHDQVEAMTMADRIVCLNDGVVQQAGPPQDLYDDPANRFVAAFLGSPAMNLVDGRIGTRAGRPALFIGDEPLCDAHPALAARAGAPVTAGFRPERLRLGDAGDGLPAVVELAEHTGIGTILHLRTAAAALQAYTTARLSWRPGDRLGLHLDAADLLLFDPDGGARLRP